MRTLACIVFVASAIAMASTQPETNPLPLGVEMAPEPLRLDEVGLSLQLPVGASAQAGTTGTIAAQITGPEDQWFMTIQTPRADSDTMTPREFGTQIIEALRRQHGVIHSKPANGNDGERIESIEYSDAELLPGRISNLLVDGFPADRFYMLVPDGVSDEKMLRGYTVVRSSPSQFVVFEFMSSLINRAANQRTYETIVAAADFADPLSAEAERGKAVMRGSVVLSDLTEADYARALQLNHDRWERLYSPASTGADLDATEHGYRHIRAWRGRRGEMTDGLDPARYNAADQEEGFLIAMDSRLLQDDGSTIDSAARFFMSLDGEREHWTILMTVRGVQTTSSTRPPPTYAETGARDGRSMQVAIIAPGEPAKDVRPIIKGGGYISQVQAFLVQSLLVGAGIPDEYGFYAYQSREQQIRLRRIVVDHPPQSPSQWRTAVTLRENEPAQVTLYAADGSFIRSILPDGKVWEPANPDRLADLWQYKGLPMN